MENILNIDYLKSNCKRIYYFGLGFIQVVLSKDERVHFYTDKLPTTNEDIHTHRYNFKSTILKGRFTNKKFSIVEGATHVLKNESCSLDRELTNNIEIPVSIKHIESITYKEGESYNMFFNEFHSVEYFGDTITHLKRSDIITDYAQVIFENGSEEICPFSNKIEDDELWKIIEAML